ncbi:MAG: alginate export family protein [Pseudomonadota bacterium]
MTFGNLATALILLGLFFETNQAHAQSVFEKVSFFGETRLRVEHADQEDFSSDANGITIRFRPALEAELFSRVTALVEAEAIFAVLDDFDDGSGNMPERPIILDPNGLELNRALLQFETTDESFLTIGRQTLTLDDQRFIGSLAFRQNDQTFDAAHFSGRFFDGVTIQGGYFDRVNRIQGADNPVGRFRGDSYYVNANVPTPFGRLGAFHYAFDLGTESDLPVSDVFSSRTTGVRLDGRFHRDDVGLDWEASFARQVDHADNPLNYSADYWLAGLTAFAGPARLNVRFESLGAGGEQSFQTPVGTLHAFQGAADVFLVTPEDGIEDFSVAGSWNFGRVRPFRNISTRLTYHRFESETGRTDLGEEIDFDITAALGSFRIAFTVADYNADSFASDTQRIFFSIAHRF